MTREQVISFTDYGPYEPGSISGGVETTNAVIDGRKSHVGFAFDGDKVSYIQTWKYEGSDFAETKIAALDVFDLFTTRFGGAKLPPLKLNDQLVFNRTGMMVFLDHLFGRSPQVTEDMNEKAKRDGKKKIIATYVYDLVPVNQPSNCRLHSQLGYSSKFNKFYVMFFEELPGSKSREVKVNVHLDFDE